jgi:RNA polymerase sigma-70 factor (ECF subfamily)
VSGQEQPVGDPRARLLACYETALPHVYGYLLHRCGRQALAEDLTAETFLAAVDAVRGDDPPQVTTAWLVGVARHKLVDHWRRQAREDRGLRAVATDPSLEHVAGTAGPGGEDPWDLHLDAIRARDTLACIAPHHRVALTLRYLDDLPVPEVAALLGRTVHATEALLGRARTAFRRAYQDDLDEGRHGTGKEGGRE